MTTQVLVTNEGPRLITVEQQDLDSDGVPAPSTIKPTTIPAAGAQIFYVHTGRRLVITEE